MKLISAVGTFDPKSARQLIRLLRAAGGAGFSVCDDNGHIVANVTLDNDNTFSARSV